MIPSQNSSQKILSFEPKFHFFVKVEQLLMLILRILFSDGETMPERVVGSVFCWLDPSKSKRKKIQDSPSIGPVRSLGGVIF